MSRIVRVRPDARPHRPHVHPRGAHRRSISLVRHAADAAVVHP